LCIPNLLLGAVRQNLQRKYTGRTAHVSISDQSGRRAPTPNKKIIRCAAFTELDGEAIKSSRRTQPLRRWQHDIRCVQRIDDPFCPHAQVRRARLQLFCNTASQFTHA